MGIFIRAENGALRAEFAKSLDGEGSFGYNKKYYSRDMRGGEAIIQEDLERINADLEKDYKGKAEEVSIYDGELSAKAENSYNKAKQFLGIISRKSGKRIGLVVTNSSTQFNGANIHDRIYVTADNLESGKVFKTIVEETTHFAEGTAEHSALVALLSSDRSLVESTIDRLLHTKGYGFDAEKLRLIGDKIARGEVDASVFSGEAIRYSQKEFAELTDDERGDLLYYKGGQSYSLNERLRETPDVDSLPEDVRKKVETLDSALKKLPTYEGVTYRNIGFDDNGGAEAFRAFMSAHQEGWPILYSAYTSTSTAQDGYPVGGNYVVHMVIEGKTGRNLDGFGNNMEHEVLFERETVFFINKIVYAENGIPTIYMQEVNENGIGQLYSAERGETMRVVQSSRSYDSDMQGLSERNSDGDSSGQVGSQGEIPRGQRDSVRAEGSEQRTNRTVREEQDRGNGEEKLNSDDYAMYAEFASELGAHMSAEILGNEAFIDRIIRSDASLAEKILGKIIDLKDALSRIGDAEAQAQHKRLVAAEKLYLKAIEAAGYQYVNGKIMVPEDEESKKDLSYRNLDASDYYTNSEIYSYDFLVSQKPMKTVFLPALSKVKGEDGKINQKRVIEFGRENAKKVGEEIDGEIYVTNNYTGTKYRITNDSIRHGLNGDQYRLRTNARLGAVVGEIVQNAIPINGLKNTNPQTTGTYAMAAYTADSEGREFISIITVEQYSNAIVAIDSYDVVHAISGRQKSSRDARLGTKPQGLTPSTNISASISISQLLNFVNSTYQSILSDDVLQKLGEKRNLKGYYSGRVLFSLKDENSVESHATNAKDNKRSTSYTKEEARVLVDRVMELFSGEGYSGALPGKRTEAIDRAHAILNGAEPGKRASAALDFADYLIRSAVLEDDVAANPDYELHVRTMEALKPYLRRLDLGSIREEIQHRYDDRARAVFTRWGKTKNVRAVGIDQMVAELQSEVGYEVGEHSNPVDAFFEIDRDYCAARDALKENAKTAVSEVFTEKELKALRQQIAKEVLASYDGRASSRATLIQIANKALSDVERLTAENRRLDREARKSRSERDEAIVKKNRAEARLADETKRRKDAEEFGKVANRVIKLVNGIKDWKNGTFESAAESNGDMFKGIIGQIGNIAPRGNIGPISARKAMHALGEWYGQPAKHPIVKELQEGDQKLYSEEMLQKMYALGNEKAIKESVPLTVEEMQDLEAVVRHLKWNMIFEFSYTVLKPIQKGIVMVIYTVKNGDSVYSIARAYGTTPDRIVADNDLRNPSGLVVGQTLVIQQPLVSYRVRGGDTLYSVSQQFGISLNQLLRNNPSLMGGGNLTVGQTLNIVLPQPIYNREIDVNGYVYPNVSRETLMRTLPYLTYITVFTYGIREDGQLTVVDDEEIIELARQYGVAPIMQISSVTERGTFSTEAATRLFSDEALQEQVINNLVEILERKRYEGIDVDFEYVEGQYANAYVAFVEKLHARLSPLGYEVFVAVAPKYNAEQEGLLYEGHDYQGLGAAADGILLMTYEWGYAFGEPQAVSPLDKVRRVVDYGVSVIPPQKIFLGMPNYGYDWQLPFVMGETRARSLSNVEAVTLAGEQNAAIRFDEVAQSPNFNYFVRENGRPVEHVVWFEDAKSVAAMLGLVEEYGLRGFSVWNLMRYFPQMWLVLNNTFRIRRGLS